MSETLHSATAELAKKFDVPGVAVGVFADGRDEYAYRGVTSIENPLPVDETTLFQFGSTGKTFTATAVLRLVDEGKLSLDDPVHKYLPDFELQDDRVAQTVTVRQLFNHTAGWEGDMMDDTGEDDQALTKYVALMKKLIQVYQPGQYVSYNNASLSVAGRIMEVLTGKTYEQAMRDLVLEPLGLNDTFFFTREFMTRRFVVGHNKGKDGKITVAQPWGMPRGNSAAGGMVATARDQIEWARLHLGLRSDDAAQEVLRPETRVLMQQPTAYMPGSAIGDAVGISWLLSTEGGLPVVSHGGTTIGQLSEFVMVPERGFAWVSMTNSSPNGSEFNDRLREWVFEHYLGVKIEEPTPIDLDDATLQRYTGTYETIAVDCAITAKDGRLVTTIKVRPEMAEVLESIGEEMPEEDPVMTLGMISLDGDRFVVVDGDGKGQKGYFVRSDDGGIFGVHIGGRLATRKSDN